MVCVHLLSSRCTALRGAWPCTAGNALPHPAPASGHAPPAPGPRKRSPLPRDAVHLPGGTPGRPEAPSASAAVAVVFAGAERAGQSSPRLHGAARRLGRLLALPAWKPPREPVPSAVPRPAPQTRWAPPGQAHGGVLRSRSCLRAARGRRLGSSRRLGRRRRRGGIFPLRSCERPRPARVAAWVYISLFISWQAKKPPGSGHAVSPYL